jgi:hypothetical protein
LEPSAVIAVPVRQKFNFLRRQIEMAAPLAALGMALKQRRPTADFVHHADFGGQYVSTVYRQRLALVVSMVSLARRSYTTASGSTASSASKALF